MMRENAAAAALFGLLVVLGCGPAPVHAADQEQEAMPDYSQRGADTCLRCHGGEESAHLLEIFEGPHAVVADSRTPFAGNQCEACHGPGGDHGGRVGFGQERPPMPAFGPNSLWSEERENAICQGCHEKPGHGFWAGSSHQREDVGCADCHSSHARRDPVSQASRQSAICNDCHTDIGGRINRFYAHPVRHGQMACTDCHKPHGGPGDNLLTRATINQTCFECHAEKRGPFLWEHQPVTEDCGLCHRPHGSNSPALLTRRTPLLCQQCHSRSGHPSIGRTANDLPGRQPSVFLLNESCSNCHSKVHGSNHPSGALLNR